MTSLHARYACLGCPPSSRCAAFVASDTDPRTNTAVPRMIPQSSDEICILCHHPWIVHEGQARLDPAHVNFPFRRGGCPDTKCGGFFADQPRWSFLTSCVCLAAWMSHHPVVDSINFASATSRPPVSGAPLPGVAPPPALTVSAPAPISAYQGPPAAVTGSAGTRRVASALRTLPHNQIASSSSAASVHRGPRRGFPSGSNPFSSNLSLLIALWPLVIPGVHEPAGYGTRLLKAQNDHMLDVLNRLKLHNLLITVNVPRNGIASAVDFTSQLVAALAPHRLSLAPHPDPLDDAQASQLNAQPFSLLSPTRRADVITFKPHPTINANIFGAEEFAKLGKKFKNPDPAAPAAATAILIFIAPRFGHVSGPIDCPSFGAQDLPDDGLALSHPCFAARVLDGLPLAGSAMFPDPQCMSDICPSLEPIRMATPPPLPSVSLVRPRSSPENSSSPARRVRQRQASLDSPRAAPLIPRPAPPPQYSVLRRADMAPLVVDRDIAPLHEILDFQDHLRRAANGLYQGRFNLHAHDVATAAQGIRTLLAILVEADADDTEPIAFQLPPGVINCARIKSVASFFRDGHGIRLGIRDGGAEVSFGPGPERAVYREAITIMVSEKDFWQQAPSSGYYIPVLTPGAVSVAARTTRFKADGSLLAIHCYTLASGPHPVSIWLLLALCMGKTAMLISKRFVAALDPIAFECLAPWFTLEPEDPIPTDFMHPFCQFLMSVMDMQPSMIDTPRTQEDHDKWTIAFMSKVLLGSTTPWDNADFCALQSGFDVAVNGTSMIMELDGALGVAPLLAWLYDRQVRRVEELTSRLVYQILMHATDDTTPYFGALFRLLLLRYLDGVGHPPELRGGLIPEDDWSEQVNNPLLRTQLLLRAASDNDLLPPGDTWRLKASLFLYCLSLAAHMDPSLSSSVSTHLEALLPLPQSSIRPKTMRFKVTAALRMFALLAWQRNLRKDLAISGDVHNSRIEQFWFTLRQRMNGN
ncbi:hypothetical protein FB451DRAFT_1555697 [Mycena latifolia]|nr:hypothetical protein FB451DRAFT_1555697 [Mycena latifolia]